MRREAKFFLLFSFIFLISLFLYGQNNPELVITPNYSKNILKIEVKNFVNDEIKSFIKYGIKFKLILKIDIYKKRLFFNKKISEIIKEKKFYYDPVKDMFLIEDNSSIDNLNSYKDFLNNISNFTLKLDFCKYKDMILNINYTLVSEVGRKYELKNKLVISCREKKKKE